MPPLSMLIKPVSGSCNLRCRYCFYHSLTDSRAVKNYGMMPAETLETIVKKALEFADGTCTFAFQGGEPTLAGVPFYEKLIEYQKKYNIKKTEIHNAIQTNGMVIDKPWSEFLAKNGFLVGLSLDGYKELHDLNRMTSSGGESFSTVAKAAELFDQSGVSYNILSVVTKQSAKHAAKIYSFFKKKGFRYLQFIPCLDPLDEPRGGYPYSLTGEDYLTFLTTMFDLWYRDMRSGELVSIRWFDNILGMFMGRPPEACGMAGECSCQFVIEADGSVYPCDFYVTDRWKIGDIAADGFADMRNTPLCGEFIGESRTIHPDCMACRWADLCRGGCKRDREPIGGGSGKNYFCGSYQSFFDYSHERFRELAMLLLRNHYSRRKI